MPGGRAVTPGADSGKNKRSRMQGYRPGLPCRLSPQGGQPGAGAVKDDTRVQQGGEMPLRCEGWNLGRGGWVAKRLIGDSRELSSDRASRCSRLHQILLCWTQDHSKEILT